MAQKKNLRELHLFEAKRPLVGKVVASEKVYEALTPKTVPNRFGKSQEKTPYSNQKKTWNHSKAETASNPFVGGKTSAGPRKSNALQVPVQSID